MSSITEIAEERVAEYCDDDSNSNGKVAGRIQVELDEDDVEDCKQIAQARNESYESGKTADTNYTDDGGAEVHEIGLYAEKALSLMYEEAEIDRSISASGDDGVDATVEINGELKEVDIKATSYQNGWLLVKQGYNHTESQDVFISSFVDDSGDTPVVELVGWVSHDKLVREENLELSPSEYYDHENYTMKRGFEPLPEPNTERDWEET